MLWDSDFYGIKVKKTEEGKKNLILLGIHFHFEAKLWDKWRSTINCRENQEEKSDEMIRIKKVN